MQPLELPHRLTRVDCFNSFLARDFTARHRYTINTHTKKTSTRAVFVSPLSTVMVVHRRKSHRRAFAVEEAQRCAGHVIDLVPSASMPPRLSVDFPEGLDPSAGDLNEERADRKRQQILSLAAHALTLLDAGDTCVEFGAGRGHLGLLIAHLRPEVHVILVEIKEFACNGARARIATLGASNVSVYCGSIDDFAQSGTLFDCAVGLHLCGLLTDSVLDLASARGAKCALVPCCYGQIWGAEDHDRGGETAPRMHPRSSTVRALLGDTEGRQLFGSVAKAADYAVVGKGGTFDVASAAFVAARFCMRLIDTDRALYFRERNAAAGIAAPTISIGVLEPLTCSPKASILLVAPPPAQAGMVSGTTAPTTLAAANGDEGPSSSAQQVVDHTHGGDDA